MSDGLRDSSSMEVDTSPRGIAISHFYSAHWSPGKIGGLLTRLYDLGYIDVVGEYPNTRVVIVERL